MESSIPIGLRIAIISREFRKRMDERAVSMGLTSVQLRVLGNVSLMEASGKSEINQKDLEQIEHVTHPTMTGIIKRLESKGFLKCVPSSVDRRYKKIMCTEKSVKIHERIAEQDKEVLFELCKDFSKGQVDDFVYMTELILKNISK